jgi:quercetin dioxygenase-like cupin family protein
MALTDGPQLIATAVVRVRTKIRIATSFDRFPRNGIKPCRPFVGAPGGGRQAAEYGRRVAERDRQADAFAYDGACFSVCPMEEQTSPERLPGIALIGLSTFPVDDDEKTHFAGLAELRRIPGFRLEARLMHVDFQDGAKTLWHYHRGVQVLWFVDGEGEVEQQGDEASPIRCGAGQMVRVLPYVRHRHGARVGQSASHLAITSGSTCWEDDPCWKSERGLLEGLLNDKQG